ncbi:MULTISPECIES: alpha/beta fold hydrolase [unclassified Imperialibacter]|uniref:alpha/beta fold hydrolase n=1 Tax=unclassified Imperialibacter TaxID=2629706 RepID=UPI001253D9EE|nr:MULTISPECIES: alpha/beta hydrolase [unclassified Imperialibacter]CAD5270861.1 Alpha/beta hydrolase [Imperialibacter sp. 75]CAD5298708.1 Alpha/beta hydrolase [Imperialibacter sp. 89]VVT35680.1 Alpha/beta hydrolase [Imperialibacter sp. EC-SDR9]
MKNFSQPMMLSLGVAVALLASCSTKNSEPMESTKSTEKTAYFKSGYSDVNGLKMYYEIHGEGDPLVLIHGGGSTIQTTFGNIIPDLAKNHKLIAVELQAHGRTSDRDAPETFEQDADDVVTLLQNLGIAKASFFGFSNGGNTTMQIGIRHPEMVNKLIIASAFFKREGMFPGFFDGMEHASLDNMPADLKEAFWAINPDSTKLLAMFNHDKNRMLGFQDWDEALLQSIQAPSLIINGDQDVVQNTHAALMASLIPNARLMILPGNHGSYMGQVEGSYTRSKTTELTLAVIDELLNGE